MPRSRYHKMIGSHSSVCARKNTKRRQQKCNVVQVFYQSSIKTCVDPTGFLLIRLMPTPEGSLDASCCDVTLTNRGGAPVRATTYATVLIILTQPPPLVCYLGPSVHLAMAYLGVCSHCKCIYMSTKCFLITVDSST